MTPSPDQLAEIHSRMQAVAGQLRLPLRSGQWRGTAGSVLGQGTGSSIDFQDQRVYAPGDDPRHINWQTTARTGVPTMKLFRQEVTPRVDLLIDGSASMFLNEAKAERVWELVYFCVESALQLGGSLRVHWLEEEVEERMREQVLGYQWALRDNAKADLSLAAGRVALRQGSLRLLISDLLTEVAPEAVLPVLQAGQGRLVALVPWCREEADPDWGGNIEFEDCESGLRSLRRVEGDLLSRYRAAYGIHHRLWREQAQRYGAVLARVGAETAFLQAMQAEALTMGAVELG